MNWQKKSTKISIAFILLLFVGGFLLMYKGNDAVAMALKKKEGIVTAEQVKVSFNSVNGRLIKEAVKEAQQVKKGDVLMVLDARIRTWP
jgi:HlyD family secretion protein